jgi:hypothetical protein
MRMELASFFTDRKITFESVLNSRPGIAPFGIAPGASLQRADRMVLFDRY